MGLILFYNFNKINQSFKTCFCCICVEVQIGYVVEAAIGDSNQALFKTSQIA